MSQELTVTQLAEHGRSLIPCRKTKKPYLESWLQYQQRPATLDQLRAWKREYDPEAWAMVTGQVSGVITLDFDGQTAEKLMRDCGLQPHRQSGSGGFHVDFNHPRFRVGTLNSKSKHELGRRFPGVDIRGDGGYVLVKGRNESGQYKWIGNHPPYDIAVLPGDLREVLGLIPPSIHSARSSGDASQSSDGNGRRVPVELLIDRALAIAPNDGRNNAGAWLACQLRDNGYSTVEAEAHLQSYKAKVPDTNAHGKIEPYTTREIHATVRQAFSRPPREPWMALSSRGNGNGSPIVRNSEVDGSSLPQSPGIRQWPNSPAEEAYYGLAGDVVRTILPHTEASPVALLIQTLLSFGSVIGRTAHFVAEGSEHYMNLFAVLVGVTSGGRKGSSWSRIFRLFRMVDPNWASSCVPSGLSSGEGLIWAVRDPITKHERVRNQQQILAEYEEVTADPGVSDKRLLVFESEYASPLRMMARDGNILSTTLRQAWDTGNLRTLTKNSPAVSTAAHISILGHITGTELRRELGTTDMGNGFANRHLWVCTVRSKELPEGGGSLPDGDLESLAESLRATVEFAKRTTEMKRDPAIKNMWAKVYHEITAGRTGLLGAVTSRAEAQTMRLACIYALLDQRQIVCKEHLLAALALWEYCSASARFIFGDALGDPTADSILRALRATPEGLDRTAISEVLGRHKNSAEISRALGLLQEYGLASARRGGEDKSGRPRETWTLVAQSAN